MIALDKLRDPISIMLNLMQRDYAGLCIVLYERGLEDMYISRVTPQTMDEMIRLCAPTMMIVNILQKTDLILDHLHARTACWAGRLDLVKDLCLVILPKRVEDLVVAAVCGGRPKTARYLRAFVGRPEKSFSYFMRQAASARGGVRGVVWAIGFVCDELFQGRGKMTWTEYCPVHERIRSRFSSAQLPAIWRFVQQKNIILPLQENR